MADRRSNCIAYNHGRESVVLLNMLCILDSSYLYINNQNMFPTRNGSVTQHAMHTRVKLFIHI